MDKQRIILTLEELKDFLRDIGCGDIYGTLGHDSGGILSHAVLHNDPCCHEIDSDGNMVTCQLNPRDKLNVSKVYDDIRGIIDRGRENCFIQKIDEIVNALNNQD
jgi:hypothetical protein